MSGKRCAPTQFRLNPQSSFLRLASCVLLLLLFFSCSSPLPPPPPPVGPDTTSHDFIWQIDTLGDGNSSVLYDVAIINDTTVWVVGQIYLKDSTGQIDPSVYALAKWNGRHWDYQRVPYHDFGTTQTYPGPLFAIQSFGVDDVFVCSYANLLHWNGGVWEEKAFFMTAIPFENQIQKMWGAGGSDLYCVGRAGGIFHYNGTMWQKIESGTTVDLVDVWGSGEDNVWIAAETASFGESELLRMDHGIVSQVYKYGPGVSTPSDTSFLGTIVGSVWTDNFDSVMVMTSSGNYVLTYPDGTMRRFWRPPFHQTGWPLRLRGTAWNDVFGVGQIGTIYHFNGASTQVYWQFIDVISGPDLKSVAVTGTLVAAVGDGGIVIRGCRR